MNKTGLDHLLREAAAKGRVAGVVALAADRNGPIYEAAFGERVRGGGVAMTLDTVFHIASMTKAITAAAAMQLVEQGKISLDEPLGRLLPYLDQSPVLEGFDAADQPRLRPARAPVTLRQLLTHTAGFAYDIWNADLNRYLKAAGLPGARSGRLKGLEQPLAFEPGTRWEYGIGIDWAGRVVEAVSGQDLNSYVLDHILRPLGMKDTSYVPDDAQAGRGAGLHVRHPDGTLSGQDFRKPSFPEFFPGGAGLVSTGPDYLRFLQALLTGGGGVLRPETVAMMLQNQMGELDVLPLRTAEPGLSHDFEFFPGQPKKWGLSFLINTKAVPGRRGAGSAGWAGLFNCYYWLDPGAGVAGVMLTQSLPFADPVLLDLFGQFEAGVYAA